MQNEMKLFLAKIVNLMKDENLFATQGGPIILAQVENEYGNVEWAYGVSGELYVKWAAETAVSLNTTVPWVMCAQADAPDSVINTCNGFYCDRFTPNSPSKPKMWTENYVGWFLAFGYSVPYRPVEDLAFAVARFFETGGTFQNYYMAHVYYKTSNDCAAFLANYGSSSDANVTFNGKSYFLPAWSVSILPDRKNVIFNTAKARFSPPEGRGPVSLNLSSMGKGQAWVNGQHVGRYWSSYRSPSTGCSDNCDYRGAYDSWKCLKICGQPAQVLYHVPCSWLTPAKNLLVLHEELGGDPSKISLSMRSGQKICTHVSESDPPPVDTWKPNKDIAYQEPSLRLNCEQGWTIIAVNIASFGTPGVVIWMCYQ
ncbi:hypothetical protein K7X08_018161 [Anisodus acutangulus]|uniref:beta-galactosidase n=1 Tax=Anisodus acutangulus TaxID=402998 RepID=A0A9Q1R8N1_9SOLA|nr:hypothetical protein K7X08_018161 [Anisodus acutangulus]